MRHVATDIARIRRGTKLLISETISGVGSGVTVTRTAEALRVTFIDAIVGSAATPSPANTGTAGNEPPTVTVSADRKTLTVKNNYAAGISATFVVTLSCTY